MIVWNAELFKLLTNTSASCELVDTYRVYIGAFSSFSLMIIYVDFDMFGLGILYWIVFNAYY